MGWAAAMLVFLGGALLYTHRARLLGPDSSRMAGVYHSVAEFQQSFFVDPTAVYLAGRALSVACGAATVVATWKLGERLLDRTTGLVAAGFVAVAPFAVRDAHYVKHDVPAALAAAAAVAVGANGLLLFQYQLFMKGWRDIAPYPDTFAGLWVERFLVPFRVLGRLLGGRPA